MIDPLTLKAGAMTKQAIVGVLPYVGKYGLGTILALLFSLWMIYRVDAAVVQTADDMALAKQAMGAFAKEAVDAHKAQIGLLRQICVNSSPTPAEVQACLK